MKDEAMRLGAIYRPAPLAIRPLAVRAGLHLMTAPPRADWYAKAPADGDSLGNDRYGCCVPVADYQLIRVHRANAWGDSWKPTTDMTLGRYAAMTGFDPATGQPDNGTDTADDLTAWCCHGIRIDSQNLDVPRWAVINPAEPEHVNLAIAHLGGIQITISLPAAAEDPSIWSKAPGTGPSWQPGTLGQHRITSSKYDELTRTVRTWGLDIEMHPEFWSRYVIATDAILSREWLDATGLTPDDLDWDALTGDLAAL